ncbi:MAG: monooxygenase, partial [Rhodospirillales bacterium]|nr:monooxygenase [Rhodospirillales bacterium]
MLSDDPHHAATTWLADFNTALGVGDARAAAALFRPDGHWRDLLAFGTDFTTVSGAAAIERRLGETLPRTRPRDLRLDPKRTPPRHVIRAGENVMEAIIAFETATGPANGVLRLVQTAEGPRAWTLMTALDGLHGQSEGAPDNVHGTRQFSGDNWLDRREKARAYADHDPAVIVVGAGQAGLAIAARLGALGVDTLVIDRHARIGDNWRKRYHALTLHNEVHVNHFPDMPFPPTWPVYIPKDKLANWFEAYAESMELNV